MASQTDVELLTALAAFGRRVPVAFIILVAGSGQVHPFSTRRPLAFQKFPRVTLWAWEEPEDLRYLDAQRYGVAYLDQTIHVSRELVTRPRRQPLLVPSGVKLTAVVRIEAVQGVDLDAPSLPGMVAKLIKHSAERPGVAALQIDFDATRSQRIFYAKTIRAVRGILPQDMPFSITALASWCGADDWISGLPVDEAVPMFFRMGRDRQPSNQGGWTYAIREPLCGTSLGVSMDEPWAALQPGQRVYIFDPRPWSRVALANVERLLKP
jgi:hypothetical protein